MLNNKRIRYIITLLLGMAVLAGVLPLLNLINNSPSSLRLILGVEHSLSYRLPLSLVIEPNKSSGHSQGFIINDIPVPASGGTQYKTPLRILPQSTGRALMSLKLFGLIPVRRLTIDVIPAVKVVPGGQAIGVLLTCNGVIVVAHTSLTGIDGVRYYPADEADIQIGDVIVSINGERANSSDRVSRLVSQHSASGQPLTLQVKRSGMTLTRRLSPILTRVAKRGRAGSSYEYRMGLYIEDNVAGVGTLTFYSPANGKFAALGHVITDGATNRRIEITGGKIVRAGIDGIQQGSRGQPGEKIGSFDGSGDIAGNIEKNSEYGIYGRLSHFPTSQNSKAIPIAVASQIRTGSAEILTVLANNKVERFKVEIQRVYHQDKPQTKGLVIRVVDPRLLKVTGGIIQGMSGSPILQDGRLVGAITHVFVNDPSRGYGVLAEWMVMEAGIIRKPA